VGLNILITSIEIKSWNVDACGKRSGDWVTDAVTIADVPFEKTTAVTPGFEERDLRAGGTSGKVERES